MATTAATGIGVRLGIQTEISPGVRFGAAYQPEIDMGEFDDYAGLFAEEGDFDIPSNLTLGVAIDVGIMACLVVDYSKSTTKTLPAVSNPIAPLTDGSCARYRTGRRAAATAVSAEMMARVSAGKT